MTKKIDENEEEHLQERTTVTMSTVANDTKELIKNKIDILDLLDDKDLEDLIKLIERLVLEEGSVLQMKK